MVGSTSERGDVVSRTRKNRRAGAIEYVPTECVTGGVSIPVLRDLPPAKAPVDWEQFRRPELEAEGARLRRLDAFVETFLDWVKS